MGPGLGHVMSPALPWPLARMHLRGFWQDKGELERKSFLYIALARNGKELHCRKISGKEPAPRVASHFEFCLDRGSVWVQDAKPGDCFEMKYQVGKRCRLMASGMSIVLVPRELESCEHEGQCQQITAKALTTGRCKNPMCSYVAERRGYCCKACEQYRATSTSRLDNVESHVDSTAYVQLEATAI